MVFFVCVKRIAVVTLTAWLEAESIKSLCCTPVKAFNHRAIGIRFLLWNNQQTYGQGIWDNRGGIRGCLRGHIQEGVWMSTQFSSSQLEKLVEAFPRGHRDPGAGALLGGTIWVGQPLLLLSLPCQDEPWQDTERKGMMTHSVTAVQDPKGREGMGLMTEGIAVVVSNGRQRWFFFP